MITLIRSMLIGAPAVVLALLASATVTAQQPVPLPNPNLALRAAGVVSAIATQPNGGVLIGGSFSSVDEVERGNLARFTPAGQLDASFDLPTNNSVTAIVVLADGSVIVSGAFTQISGQNRNHIARVLPNGSLDPNWLPGPNNQVFALALDANGHVFVGGAFTSVGGTPRAGLARILASGNGTLDPNWDPAPGNVTKLLFDGTRDALFVSGSFTSIGGITRANLARISASGTGAAVASFNASLTSTLQAMALDASGALLVGGSFTSIGGQSRNRIARLDAGTGLADPVWNPDITGSSVNGLQVDASGNIYVGGDFTNVGDLPRPMLARLDATGSGLAQAGFTPGANATVRTLGLDASGNLLAGGFFTTVAAATHAGMVRLAPNGQPIGTGRVDAPATVQRILRASNGALTLGGSFYRTGNVRRDNLLRLLPDGTLDPALAPVIEGSVRALIDDGSGGYYIGGSFFRVNGAFRGRMARIDTNGELDTVFLPNPNNVPAAFVRDATGAVYVTGAFTNIGGQPRSRLAKISGTTGSADLAWNVAATGSPSDLLLDADAGLIYLGGSLTAVGGQVVTNLARFTLSGVVDSGWIPAVSGSVITMAMSGASQLVIGGNITSVNSVARGGVARISTAAGAALDINWNPAGNGSVLAIAVAADGSSYLGGNFNLLAGVSRSRIARVLPSGALDLSWNPGASGNADSLFLTDAGETLLVGGRFTILGGASRLGVGALPATTEPVFRNGFE